MPRLGSQRWPKVDRGLDHNGLTEFRDSAHGRIRWDPRDKQNRRVHLYIHQKKVSRDGQKEMLRQIGESQEVWHEKMQRL